MTKAKAPCYHGCPEDTGFFKCWAYDAQGNLCGKPAVVYDHQRGAYVCEGHKTIMVQILRLEAAGFP